MKKLLKKKKQITRSIEGYTKFMQKKNKLSTNKGS